MAVRRRFHNWTVNLSGVVTAAILCAITAPREKCCKSIAIMRFLDRLTGRLRADIPSPVKFLIKIRPISFRQVFHGPDRLSDDCRDYQSLSQRRAALMPFFCNCRLPEIEINFIKCISDFTTWDRVTITRISVFILF